MGFAKRGSGDQPSKIAAKVVTALKKHHLQPEVRAHVEPGAELFTDSFKSYDGLGEEYVHGVIDHNVKYVEGKIHTNNCGGFWSQLDRTINGSYVSVDPDHLFRYLDEQSFRFNERQDSAQVRFMKVAASVAGKRLTWAALVARHEGTKPRRGGPRKHREGNSAAAG